MHLSIKSKIIIAILTAVLLVGIFAYLGQKKKLPLAQPLGASVSATEIDAKIKSMTLDEKIGQLVIAGFDTTYPDASIQTLIKDDHIGGINLLKRNVADEKQIKKLTADLQAMSAIPLFLGTDQEGGDVIRFHFLSETTKESKIKTAAQAESIAYERALELKPLGINMNFSPVAEYVADHSSYMFYRTFEEIPEMNGALAAAMIRGYTKAGMISVSKHFPGYGNALSNPHVDAASSEVDMKTYNGNLQSFGAVLSTNIAPAVMVAHVIIPSVDPLYPASSSEKFITGILRKQIGYNGVIITDDIGMTAAGSDPRETAKRAIQAGADMLLVSMEPNEATVVIDSLREAVRKGEITEARIDESLRRILALKSSM